MIKTAEQLAEVCYMMPKMPGIGTIYAQGLFPIPAEQHVSLRETLEKYYIWVVDKGPEPDEMEFEMMRQYLIYHIHAPCWLQNPYSDGSDIKAMMQKAIEIKNWGDMNEYKSELTDLGLDPF